MPPIPSKTSIILIHVQVTFIDFLKVEMSECFQISFWVKNVTFKISKWSTYTTASFFFFPISFWYKQVNEIEKSKILMSLNQRFPKTEVQIFDKKDIESDFDLL